MDFPYEKTFLAIEKSLLDYGALSKPREEIQHRLDEYKHYGGRELTDELCFRILVEVVFYSGMRAATVTDRLPAIHGHFGDCRKAAQFDRMEIERMLNDAAVLRNRRKIEACIRNAQVMQEIVGRHGSFASYLATFELDPSDQTDAGFENLLLLKEELEARFAYLGGITVYHFLTELGLPVLKPDRVIARIFRRLGLVEYDSQHLKTVIHGRKFAKATGLPIRYTDIVLVAYGQVRSIEFGVDRGICLDQPRCNLCNVTDICQFHLQQAPVP